MSLKLGLRNKIRRSRAGGAVPILLDQSFASGATAAYSLRQLKSSATKAVRVREDNGNTETDIGFSGGTLDETALLNHCGSNNGFVTKWYDQSGNGNDASNSTASAQPQIVSSGSVIKENGKPALQFGANISLKTSLNFDYNVSVYVVASPLVSQGNINDQKYLFDQGIFSIGFGSRFRGEGLEHRTDDGSNSKEEQLSFTNKQYFLSYLFSKSNSLIETQDNSKTFTALATTIQGGNTLDIGSSDFSGGTNNDFYIQEEIFYDFDNISERSQIRQNQQNFY